MHYIKKDLALAIQRKNVKHAVNLLERIGGELSTGHFEFYDDKVSFITLAVLNGSHDCLESLIQRGGANVDRLSFVSRDWPNEKNNFNSFETSLITATRHGDLRACQILCKHNAKVNKIDSFNMTALHWAASLNLVDIVKLLIQHANINIHSLDMKNQTPVDNAITHNHFEVMQCFVDHFKVTSTDPAADSAKFRDYVMQSIKSTNPEIFRLLLSQIDTSSSSSKQSKQHFDFNLIDNAVGSLLHHAVMTSNSNNKLKSHHNEIIEILVSRDGIEIDIKNKLGETPLHIAKNVQVTRILLDRGAAMNICEITGKQPLFGFVLRDNFDLCIEMLKNGCGIDNVDRLGNSLLHTILNNGNVPIKLVLLMLEAGLGLNSDEWKDKQSKILQRYPKLAQCVEQRLRNPATLKEMSRRTLRTHLNKINCSKSIVNSVTKMKSLLPSDLQDYILFL